MGRSRQPRSPWKPARDGRYLFFPALVLFSFLSLYIASQPRAARKIMVDQAAAHEVRASEEAAVQALAVREEIANGRRQAIQKAKEVQEEPKATEVEEDSPTTPAQEEGEAPPKQEVTVPVKKTPTKVEVSHISWTEGWSMKHETHPTLAWPLYRVGVPHKQNPVHQRAHNDWPGAGYRVGTDVEFLDKKMDEVFKFYLLEEGLLDMREAEKCLRKNRGMPDGDSWEGIDSKLKIGEREHLTELFLLRALRTHPLRTKNRDEATLFIIGYAPGLARIAMPCPVYADNVGNWEEDVAEVLLGDESFNKKGGKDFLFFHSGREWKLFKKIERNTEVEVETPIQLADILDGGPMIATSERYSPDMHMGLPDLFERGSVIITPHVSSEAIDLHITAEEPPVKEDEREGPRFYFRGNMASWHGDRSHMLELAKMLKGTDFQEYDFQKHTAEETAPLLAKAAQDMRRAGLCFSPEGDSPASARLFEALGTGCVPVVVSHPSRITFDLPFPSLVDYDAIAVFTEPFRDVANAVHGGGIGALSGSLMHTLHDELTERMRHDGFKAFKRFFSYMNNPNGVVRGVLMEAWILMMKKNIVTDKYIR